MLIEDVKPSTAVLVASGAVALVGLYMYKQRKTCSGLKPISALKSLAQRRRRRHGGGRRYGSGTRATVGIGHGGRPARGTRRGRRRHYHGSSAYYPRWNYYGLYDYYPYNYGYGYYGGVPAYPMTYLTADKQQCCDAPETCGHPANSTFCCNYPYMCSPTV